MSLTTTHHPEPAQSNESAVRDALARVRTRHANERTFLAYIRTSLAFFAAGARLIKFFDAHWAHHDFVRAVHLHPVLGGACS